MTFYRVKLRAHLQRISHHPSNYLSSPNQPSIPHRPGVYGSTNNEQQQSQWEWSADSELENKSRLVKGCDDVKAATSLSVGNDVQFETMNVSAIDKAGQKVKKTQVEEEISQLSTELKVKKRQVGLHVNLFNIHRGPLEKCLGYALPILDAICLCVQKLFLVDWAFSNVPISWKDVETKWFGLYFPNFMIAFIEFGFVAIDVGALALVPQIHFSVHMWTNEALLLVLLSAIMHSQTMEFVISSILLQSPNREALRVFSNMQNLYHRQSNFSSQVCVHLCALLHAWQVTTDDGYLQLDDKLGCDLMTMDNESKLVLYTGCQTPQICWSITYESRKSNNNISGKTCSVSLVSNSLNLYLTILLQYGIFEVGEDSVSGVFCSQLLLDLVRKMLQIWTWENGGFLQTQMIVEARDFQKRTMCCHQLVYSSSSFKGYVVLTSAILHRRFARNGAAATTILHLYWNWFHFFDGVPADIHLNYDWKESFPDVPTGRFDQFKALVRGVQILTQNVKLEDKFLLRGLHCYEIRPK